MASLASALLAYWAFATPYYGLAFNVQALSAMGFFALTAAIDIYFITGMARAMRKYRLERTRAEILAEGHANLFREYNERTANHLQLLAALLKRQVEGEPGFDHAASLGEALRRTMLISSTHRSLDPGSGRKTEFAAFARQLLKSALDAAGAAHVTVSVENSDIALPPDQAASLAIVLIEWFRTAITLLPRDKAGRIGVSLDAAGSDYRLLLTALGQPGDNPDLFPDPVTRQIVAAATDQLGGRLAVSCDHGQLVLELLLPAMAAEGPQAPNAIVAPGPNAIQ